MKNLNGVKIRGMSLKVSFTKYDKDGRPLNESAHKEDYEDRELEWRESNHRKITEGGRSFKDVVMGVPQHKREINGRHYIQEEKKTSSWVEMIIICISRI